MDTAEPRNVETELSSLAAPVTSIDDFFIRSHFPIPSMASNTHRLTVDGLVDRPLSVSLDDLQAMAPHDVTIAIECAGNSRAQLDPPVHGVPWVGGAVGNGRWSGVPLARLLEAAGVRVDGRVVLVGGADSGLVTDGDGARRVVRFERSLPLQKAMRPEVLVGTGLDGRPLTPEHGGPVRLVVGGWYGMASVKWVTSITVLAEPHDGHWETREYAMHRTADDGTRRSVPVTEMQPKAQITSPAPGSTVTVGSTGSTVRVEGLAWAGEAVVDRVELSDDGGSTWWPARVEDEARPLGWVRWTAEWRPRSVGPVGLLARCSDDRGRTQPATRDLDRGTYVINELVPYPVIVVD